MWITIHRRLLIMNQILPYILFMWLPCYNMWIEDDDDRYEDIDLGITM